MGDHVTYLAWRGQTPPNAPDLMQRVADQMRGLGLIAGEDCPDAILGDPQGPVYRPGRGLPVLGGIANLLTNGAEFLARPVVNFGPLIVGEAMSCPDCGWRPWANGDVSAQDRALADELISQIAVQTNAANFAPDAVNCLRCGSAGPVNGWVGDGSFLIAGAGLALWNWPYLPQVLDPIIAIMQQVLPDRELLQGGYKI